MAVGARLGAAIERCGEAERTVLLDDIRCWACWRALREPSRAALDAAMSLAWSARVSWRSLLRASWRTPMTVCWSDMIWACSWFSAIAVVLFRRGNEKAAWRVHTITLGKSTSVSPKAVIVHPLHHSCVSSQVVADVIISSSTIATSSTVTAAIFQAINLFLPVLGGLLCLGEFILELLDFAILLRVASFLFVLLAFI
jgi:hypothetical protein